MSATAQAEFDPLQWIAKARGMGYKLCYIPRTVNNRAAYQVIYPTPLPPGDLDLWREALPPGASNAIIGALRQEWHRIGKKWGRG